MKTLSRRKFITGAGATAAGAFLAACQPQKPEAQSGQKVQLVYQDWRTNWFPPMTQQLLEQFHLTHPNIRVFYIPDPENLEEKMILDMQAGSAADVFQGCCTHFPAWAQQGYTLDLRPFVEADLTQDIISDWDPVQYHALFTRDGRQFGLPKYHGALALYYNKDLFDQQRVAYPDGSWTYADYAQAMRRLTLPPQGGKPGVYGSMVHVDWDRIQVHVNGWGGHFVDPSDPTRCQMGAPEATAALEWLRARIWDDQIMASLPAVNYTPAMQAFIDGRLAMVEDGSWSLKDILSGARFRVGVAPFPAGPARKVTLATTDGFGIYAGTKHPEAAWELMKFLISKEYGRAMAQANFLQPARASLVSDWIGYVQEEFPQQTREMDLQAFADGQRQGYSVVAEVFANMAEVKHLAQDAWDQILTLGQQPVESIQATCQQIQEAQKSP